MEVQEDVRKLGLFFFWAGIVVVAGYYLLYFLGRWGVSVSEAFRCVEDFFTSAQIAWPLKFALPTIFLGVILIVTSRRKRARRKK